MQSLLPAWPLFSAFLVASLVLAVTPGPGVFYIVTRSVLQGRCHGLASVAGVALGNFGNALGAALGLGALFAISTTAFLVVKYTGAGYLIYLGVRALRARTPDARADSLAPARLSIVFRDGFAVALLNPKTALFFAAFLPQFVTNREASLQQSIALGAVFVGIAASTDTLYALTAGSIRPWLMRASRLSGVGRYLTGSAFLGLGVFAAFSGSRSARS